MRRVHADFLRPYLGEAADRLLRQRRCRRFTLARVRRVLREALSDDDLHSFKLSDHDDTITDFFDSHPRLERVSDDLAWEPKVKLMPQPAKSETTRNA
jgi:hypothetical protein